MVRSVELAKAIQAIADLGLTYHLSGDRVIVSLVNSFYPAGVEVLSLRKDMMSFGPGVDFDLIKREENNVVESWKNFPGEILSYLLKLDVLGLRLVARKDALSGSGCYFLATDGFVGGETLGSEENGVLPSLVLVFDDLGKPMKWGVYGR